MIGINFEPGKAGHMVSLTNLRKPAHYDSMVSKFGGGTKLPRKQKASASSRDSSPLFPGSSPQNDSVLETTEGPGSREAFDPVSIQPLKELTRYRVMVLVHCISDIPLNIDTSKNYSIKFKVFDTPIEYKLDMDCRVQTGKTQMILMKKLRVFYFFAQGREGVTNYIKEIKALPVFLKVDGRTIGEIVFDMNDFLSDKVTKREFYKLFSGSLEDIPILSWGLQFSFGLVASKVTDVSRIHLQEHMGIYLPDKYYYTFEPLPQEWLNIIEKNQEFDMDPVPIRPETTNPRKCSRSFVWR